MGKWLRWQGVVTFVLVVGLLAAVWVLLIDTWLEHTIERAATAAIGARVELDAADLTLIPLGLTLTRLQVTNPETPMTNAVEIARIAGSLDALRALRRQIIFEEMTVEGLRFKTPRRTSGAITKRPTPEEAEQKDNDGLSLPSVQLKDPKEILAKELDGLQSLKLAESLRSEVQTKKDMWQQRIAELPDKEKLTDYKQRIETLKSAGKGGLGGVLGGVQEVKKIHDELREDLDRIKRVKAELEHSATSLKKRAHEITTIPQEDVKRLIEKYSVSGRGVANVTRALFSGPLADYVQTAVRWHERLEPFLSRPTDKKAEVEMVTPIRGKGVDVRFLEAAPLPNLLVRTARVSLEIPAGAIQGTVENLTPEQHVLGAPTTFAFAAEKLEGLAAITLDGAINRVDRMNPKDTANLSIDGYRLDDLKLGGDTVSVALRQGVAELDLRASLSGPSLHATIDSKIRGAQFDTGKVINPGPVGEALSEALADVKAFQVMAIVAGTQDQFDTRVETDLDDVLKDAVGKQAKAQVARLEGQLRTAIDEKVQAKLNEVRGQLGGFDALIQDLTARLNLGQEVLKLGVGGQSGDFKLPF